MKRNTLSFLLSTSVLALALVGCKQEASTSSGAASSSKAPPAKTTTAAPAPAPAAITRATVGVAECDEWLRKVEACMAKDPAIKSRYEAGYKMMNESWPKNQAAGGSTAAALPAGCKSSLDTLDAACK